MLVINNVLADKLKEFLELQTEIKTLENEFTSFLKADAPLELLKEKRLTINYFKAKLKAKEEQALTLFN